MPATSARSSARPRAHGRLEPLDRVNGGLTSWPGGHAPYAYGLGFHEYLARTYGPDTFARLADSTARRVPYWLSGAFSNVFGKPLAALWDEYQADLKSSVASPHRAIGATRLTHHGDTVVGPRFLRHDCATCPLEVVYSVRTPHAFPTLNVIALDGSPSRPLTTRYLGSTTGVGRDAGRLRPAGAPSLRRALQRSRMRWIGAAATSGGSPKAQGSSIPIFRPTARRSWPRVRAWAGASS